MWNQNKKQKNSFIETENRLVVARSWGVEEMHDGGQKVQTSFYKTVSHGDVMYSMVTTVNKIVLYI